MPVVWGQNDKIFADAYKRDNPMAEIHMLDSGKFALETHGPQIGELIQDFVDRNAPKKGTARRK